jgi:hypothetical protein
MNLSNIKQDLASIDYSWKKPQTYLVFVPGLSIVIQKIQFANVLPLIQDMTSENLPEAAAKAERFLDICTWHGRGSLVQLTASILAVNFLSSSIFLLIALLPLYELANTFFKAFTNPVTLFEFHQNGTVKSMTKQTALSIF